jgi:inorganic pyrophosphatase
MRRGAALTENRRRPIVADLHDLEGGGIPTSNNPYVKQPSSVSSGGLSLGDSEAVSSSGKDKPRRKKYGVSYPYLTQQSPRKLQVYGFALIILIALLCPFLLIEYCILVLVFASCCFGAIASMWLAHSVLSCDDGTAEMRAVSDPIREGAEGFLHVQYNAIAKFAVPLAFLIVFSYQFRPASDEAVGVAVLGNQMLGILAALGFVFGAVCSALSGYTAMWVAARANIRVASAGRRSYGEALVVCFRGGAFSAVLNLSLCIAGTCRQSLLAFYPNSFPTSKLCLLSKGVTTFYAILHFFFVSGSSVLKPTDVPMLLVGYGFGASFVALFMQLGGGIYTKVRIEFEAVMSCTYF